MLQGYRRMDNACCLDCGVIHSKKIIGLCTKYYYYATELQNALILFIYFYRLCRSRQVKLKFTSVDANCGPLPR